MEENNEACNSCNCEKSNLPEGNSLTQKGEPIPTMRKIFQVNIEKKDYDVWDISNKEHGGYNDTPKTWWLYYGDRTPSEPSENDENFTPYCCRSINRRLWDIRLKQSNSSKYKWDSWRFNSHTNVEMWCNGKHIYSFGTWTDTQFAFAKIQYLMVVLSEHPYNFFEPEKENNRKIWWHGLPALIKPNSNHPGEIGIIPDYSTGVSKEEWWKEYKNRKSKINYTPTDDDLCFESDFDEDMESDYINWGNALSDGNIDWFRE